MTHTLKIKTEYYSSPVRFDFTSNSEQLIKSGTYEELKPMYDSLRSMYTNWDISSESAREWNFYTYITFVNNSNDDIMIFVTVEIDEIEK